MQSGSVAKILTFHTILFFISRENSSLNKVKDLEDTLLHFQNQYKYPET